nr:hypothetical protein Iba_chr09dCG12150 [Ipomoea batatas]
MLIHIQVWYPKPMRSSIGTRYQVDWIAEEVDSIIIMKKAERVRWLQVTAAVEDLRNPADLTLTELRTYGSTKIGAMVCFRVQTFSASARLQVATATAQSATLPKKTKRSVADCRVGVWKEDEEFD